MKIRDSVATGIVVLATSILTFFSFLPLSAQTTSVPSISAANRLESKIRAIEEADSPSRRVRETIQVSELELESYVLYRMEDQLPVRVDAVDLEIRPGRVGVTAEMFVDEDLVSSRPIIGPVFAGAHTVFFEGDFEVRRGLGVFNLEQVRVDGIIVPVFLVKALLESLDEPVDLDAPFRTAAGVEEVLLHERTVSVTY